MKKAAVIGHFAFGLEYFDGQTVKTKILTEELCRQFGEHEILKMDTHGSLKTLLKAPFQIFKALLCCKNVIILPAQNGLRANAPLLALERKFFKKRKIHYVVIGGWLPEFLKTKKGLAKKLKMFDGVYVETNTMKKALESQGFTNVVVMPNCKKLDIVDESDLSHHIAEPYKLCTFSRVMKEKGIEDAIHAVKAVNEECGRTVYTLDIYGQIDPSQNNWFKELQESFPAYVKYGGIVAFDQSVEVLKDYFALLFPTRFYTEGIPGTVIDAYAAGVPVISSMWESFSDVIDDRITGMGYSFQSPEMLSKLLFDIALKPQIMMDMKQACIKKAADFTPESVIHNLVGRA